MPVYGVCPSVRLLWRWGPWGHSGEMLARDAQATLALIVAQCLSIHLSICVSVRDSLSHAYVRSIARREPPRLPACLKCVEIFFNDL